MPFDLATAQPVEPKKFDPATAKPVGVPAPDTGSIMERFDAATPGAIDAVGRQIGLTARAGIQGFPLFSIPNMVGDAAGLKSSDALRGALTKLGIPEPQNPTERVVQDVGGAMSGAGGIVKGGVALTKAANPIVRRIGETLAAGPTNQVVSGATGAGAAGVTREKGGGPAAQLAAGIAGSAVPALPAAAAAAVRGLMRGGEAGRQRMLSNIDTFEDAGAGTPTVGQATETRGNRALESLLSKSPGGAGPMAAKAEEEAANLGTKVNEMATNLSPNAGAAPAGRRIRSGLEQFVEDFKGSSGKLYDELDKHIPSTQRVDVSNTRTALDKLNAGIPGAPTLSRNFKNSRIEGIKNDLRTDTETTAGVYDSLPAWQKQVLEQLPEVERTATLNGLIDGKLPYEALKKLRTLVGNEISDSTIASDVPRSKWKAFYGALSKDMAAAAQEAGPKAEAAFVRANNYHRAGMQRLDDVLGPIMKQGDPEAVFKAALSGTQEGATTISGVMKSLPTESRKAVAATMLQRLGKATPGKQNELGEVFSTETFLTNWNKLHPDSKRVLFAPLPGDMRSDLDKIAKVASNVREGSKVFSNPSGTTQALSNRDTAGGAVIALVTGHPVVAAGIGGAVISANLGARALTSPAIVHWLAESTKVPMEQLPAQLNQLFQASLYMKGDERKDARALVKELRSATQQKARGTGETEGAVQ